jgi:hypothetical protein
MKIIFFKKSLIYINIDKFSVSVLLEVDIQVKKVH